MKKLILLLATLSLGSVCWGDSARHDAEERLGNATEARGHAEAALAIVETLRTRIGGPDLRASYSALSHGAYELEIDLLMEAHRASPAAGSTSTIPRSPGSMPTWS